MLSQSNTCKNKYYTTLSNKLDMFRGPVSNQTVLGLNIEIRMVVLSAEEYFSKINSRDFLPFAELQHVVLQNFQALKAEQSLCLERHLPNGFSVTDREIHPCCISLSLILISFVTLCIPSVLALIERKRHTTFLILDIYTLRNASWRKRLL